MNTKNTKIKVKSDFILAKEVVQSLDLHKDMIVSVEKVPNFRKYLRDHSAHTGKKYVTRVVGDKVNIVRYE